MSDEKLPEYVEDALEGAGLLDHAVDEAVRASILRYGHECMDDALRDLRRRGWQDSASILRLVREQRAEAYARCAVECASMADDQSEDHDSRGAAAVLANRIHRLAAEEAKR